MACHPSSEFFVNPALTLAEHLAAGTPLLIGTDPVADALAALRLPFAGRRSPGIAGAWLGSGAGRRLAAGAGQGDRPRRTGRSPTTSSGTRTRTNRPTTASRSAPCWWSVRPASPLPCRCPEPACSPEADLRGRVRAERGLAAGRRVGVGAAPCHAHRTGGGADAGTEGGTPAWGSDRAGRLLLDNGDAQPDRLRRRSTSDCSPGRERRSTVPMVWGVRDVGGAPAIDRWPSGLGDGREPWDAAGEMKGSPVRGVDAQPDSAVCLGVTDRDRRTAGRAESVAASAGGTVDRRAPGGFLPVGRRRRRALAGRA